ncbi:DUF4190 domain-containing protein [Streptomyces sp. TRM 70361]|uniref:DUF4190 domain-containing protein n=1 Tax=Streptomyces sp. TRM 70361 TaxID=3116553 RepID=UPI002E7AFF61|nr:DUF4190 domain-containing protein [Streptomyces sp. TRM 70361]MEE1938538.1 DUF4190 domain-containing protein [Streptomyces sp. TRM 70361]
MTSYSSPEQGRGTGAPETAPHRGNPRNGMGITALVLGILALVTFWTVLGGILLGVAAIVFGVIGYRRTKRGEATNGAMALIGAITGALGLVASGVILAAGVSLLNSEEFDSYQDCIREADSTSEERQCAEDFSDEISPNN